MLCKDSYYMESIQYLKKGIKGLDLSDQSDLSD